MLRAAIAFAVFAFGSHTDASIAQVHHAPAAAPIVPSRAYARPGSAKYRIVDFGRPPGSYDITGPQAFNNAGQIIGRTFNSTTFRSDCIVYSAKSGFVDISAGKRFLTCYFGGMSDPGTGNVANLVGTVQLPGITRVYAFRGTFSTMTGAATLEPFGRLGASLYGVNTAGEAFGTAPQSGFFTPAPPVVAIPGRPGLDIAQPYCMVDAEFCANNTAYSFAPCPFGGCGINGAGWMLALDALNANLMTFRFHVRSSAQDIPTTGSGYVFVSQINDADEIVYSSSLVDFEPLLTYVYSLRTRTTTMLPALPGNSCSSYIALSVNNAGRVLGYTGQCGNPADTVYWTWDSAGGIHSLNNELPHNPYAAIAPLGINDRGQILAPLTTAGGTVKWGMLDPI